MRWNLISTFPKIDLSRRRCIDRVSLVWVYSNTEETGISLENSIIMHSNMNKTITWHHFLVLSLSLNNIMDTYIDQLRLISWFKIPKHRCLVKIGKVWHIFTFLKFWRIHLGNLIGFTCLFLKYKKLYECKWLLNVAI